MKISLVVCNVCADKDRETSRYEVRSGGRRALLDLCEEHAAPLEALMPAGDTAPRKRASSATSRRRVVTMSDIEKAKRS